MISVLACLAFFFLQAPQAPPKPASIEGFVRRVGTGEPVFKARVVLNGSATVPTGARTPDPGISKSFLTDKDGHFQFNDLQPGRYSLTAFANSYVRLAYGQKAQNLPSTPITLTAGQQVKDVVFELIPASTISGRIYDFDNMPQAGADVYLQKVAYDPNGQKTLQTVQQVRTNDLGEYRLYWITPGKYFVRVDNTGAPTPMMRSANEYIGPVDDSYSSTYYPGTSDPSSASPIDLLPGAQMSAIDLTLMRTKTYTVKGRAVITTATAPNQRAFVMLRPRQMVGFVGAGMNPMNNMDGTFEIRNVLPGSYILQANAGGGGPGAALRAEKPLEVNSDMEGVIITLSPGFDVPFHLVFESQPPTTGTNASPLANMRPMLRNVGDLVGGMMATMMNGMVIKPDGTFSMQNVIPGIYQLQIQPLPTQDWYIKAISFGRTDGLRDGLALDSSPESPIEVLLSPNAGSIKGTVVDKDGKLVPSTRVVLIPNEPSRFDRFKFAVTDANGAFTMRGIYPGAYRLFAWDMIEPNAERDPDFVRQYDEQGKPVAVAEGTNPGVELRLIKVVP